MTHHKLCPRLLDGVPGACLICQVIATAVAEERKACANMGDERAAEYERKQVKYRDEEAWWRARRVEAQDYAAAIQARS